MDADDDDPDPGGWPVHPAAALYGLWPRFAAADIAEAVDDAPAPAGAAEKVRG